MPGNSSVNSIVILDNTSHCPHGALTDSYGLIIQLLLGLLAFASLIIKLSCEPSLERRPWIIWFFDTSKQVVGALVIHFANIVISDMFQGDPCSMYITSFILDSTVGLLIIFVTIKAAQYVIRRNKWKSLKFGDYGKPPSFTYWYKQCGIYVFAMVIEKFIVTLLIQIESWRNIFSQMIVPINNPKIEVAIVVLIIPLCINIIMFWVIDNLLMNKSSHHKTHNDMKFFTNIRYQNHDKHIDSECITTLLEEP